MHWSKICAGVGIIFLVIGIAVIDISIAGDFDLSGTWILTESTSGCGDHRTETLTADITQKGDSVTLIVKERDSTMVGKIYNNEIICAGIKKVMQAKGSLPERTHDIRDYRLKISEDANTLTGKSKWHYSTSYFSCDGVSDLTYKRE